MTSYNKISDVVLDGIDYTDYPDFCDAFIVSATNAGIPLTDAELDELNDDRSFVHEQVLKHINVTLY
jgi:hypothetical protein